MSKLSKYDIVYENSVTMWDEALPLGNGKLGSLVYGDGPLRIAVDRVDLWDERPHPYTQEDGFNYKNLVKLSKSGSDEDWKERHRLFETIASDKVYPTKLTAGRIELDFGIKTDNIKSRVDIQKAIANVEIEDGKVGKAEIFLSATKFVGVARIWGEYTLDLRLPKYLSGDENGKWGNDSGIGEWSEEGCLHYPHAKKTTDKEFSYYVQDTATELKFGVVVLRKKYKNYTELYYTIANNLESEKFIESVKKELKAVALIGYEVLKEEHIKWWKKYWQVSSISIGDELLEKTYYRSYYLFASCSRKGFYPMPLQGVWTADNDSRPPWKGDYHHDTNTQMSYQSFLKANHMPEGEVFIDYLWNLREKFRQHAKEFYGVDGLLIPCASTLNGNIIGGWAQYLFSPTMSIWTAQSFDEYWLYTGDKEFLKERAYPFFKEVGAAIYALLEEKNGKLYLPLSSSPEIFNNSREAYLEPNSNFDLALLKYLFKTLVSYEEILGLDSSFNKETLTKFDDFALYNGECMMLDKNRSLHVSHRHFSHLQSLYPLHLINYDTDLNKTIYENALLEIERLGTGLWVGFSYGMCAQIYAMAQNGNAAYEKLRTYAKGYVAENAFHLNGDFKWYGFGEWHYRPFTLESAFGYCDALQEMLLQEHQGYIHVFPAVPLDWKKQKISFKGFRSYGGVIVSATAQNGKTLEVKLTVPSEREILLKNTFGVGCVQVQCNGKSQIINEQDGFIYLNKVEGTVKIFSCN